MLLGGNLGYLVHNLWHLGGNLGYLVDNLVCLGVDSGYLGVNLGYLRGNFKGILGET